MNLQAFDAAMPERERLGEFLDSVEVPTGGLKLGDEVWTRRSRGRNDATRLAVSQDVGPMPLD